MDTCRCFGWSCNVLDTFVDVLDTLIGWVLEGLDEEKAMNQPESAFKVRHLKMGITLAGALCACDSDICVQALVSDFSLLHRC